jgi:hypothetical protein
MADIPESESSFPEGSALNSSLNNLSGETQKLRLGIEELTRTLREEKSKDKESPETSKEVLECLKEMKSHLHSLLVLQRESSAAREEERRRTESEIPDTSTTSGKSSSEKTTKSSGIEDVKGGGGFSEIGKGIFYIAASVVALGIGLKLMKDIGLSEIVKTFVMLAALGTGLLIFSKLGSGTEMQKTALSLIVLAGAIAAIALSLRLIDGVKWASLIKGTFAIVLFGGALGLLSSLFDGDGMIKVGLSLIVLSGALVALSFGLDMFAKLSWLSIIKGIIGLGALGATLGVISLLFGGDKMVKSSIGLLIFSAALAVFAGSLLIMNYVNFSSILKMFAGMVLIMPLFTALMLILSPVMVIFGVGLWLVSYAISNFADAMYTLAKALLVGAIGFYILKAAVQSMDWKDLGKLGVVLVGLGAVLIGLNYALKRVGQQTFYKTAFAIAFLGASLIPLAIGLKMLGMVGWESMAKGAVALLGFGLIAKLIGGDSGSMIKAGIGFLAFSVGLIPFALGIKMFGGIGMNTVLTAAAAMIAVGGLAIMLAKGNVNGLIKAGLGLLSLGVGLIPFALGIKMFGGIGAETVLIAAAAIVSIGWISANTIGNNLGNVLKASIGMVALSVGLIGLALGLSVFEEVSLINVLVAAAAIALIGGAAVLIGNMGVGGMLKGALGIAAIGLSLIPLSIGLEIISEVSMKTVLTAAAAIALIGGAGFLIGSFGLGPILLGALGIAALGLALMPLAIGLSMMSEIGMDTIGVLAVSLVTLALAALGMGIIAPIILMGALAIAALGVSLIPLAFALNSFKGTLLKELSSSLYDFALATALMGVLSPLILLGSAVLIVLGVAILALGAGLNLGGDYLKDFNETLITFGAVAVSIIQTVGDVFGRFAEVITATGTSIGYVIDKIKDLADPTMGVTLLSTAAGITAVAAALGLLMAGGAITGVIGSAASMAGGIMEGIGNLFSGAKGGALNAVQTLSLIVQAAEYVSEIGQLSSEIDKLTAALNRLSQSPPINAEILSQIDQLIQKAEKLSEMSKGGFWDKILGVFGLGTKSPETISSVKPMKPEYYDSGVENEEDRLYGTNRKISPEAYVTVSRYDQKMAPDVETLRKAASEEREFLSYNKNDKEWQDRHEKLLEGILNELQIRGAASGMQVSTMVNAPSTNMGGGGNTTFIPIVTSSNRDSTWKATQGSLRPLG